MWLTLDVYLCCPLVCFGILYVTLSGYALSIITLCEYVVLRITDGVIFLYWAIIVLLANSHHNHVKNSVNGN